MADYELAVEPRTDLGKGAMRRLRRSGRLPGIVYGAGKEPMPIAVVENTLRKQMEHEGFFSHILSIKVEGHGEEQAVVKALQRHPATTRVLHLDLLRVSATQKLTLTVPLHFEGEEGCPGVRMGGVVSHLFTEVEVSCLPADLPEYISVDVSEVEIGGSLHLSDVVVPDGVELTALTDENDPSILNIVMPREEEEETAEEDLEAGEVSAAEGEEPGPEGDSEESSDDED